MLLHACTLSSIHAITTGCVTISVKSDTPLFSDICRRSRLSFYVVNGHCGGIDFLKKSFEIFHFVRVRARYKLRLVFRLSPVFSKFKLMLSAGIQLFVLKTTSHGKSGLKNSHLMSDLPCEVAFRPKSWIPADNMSLNLLKTGLSLKTSLCLCGAAQVGKMSRRDSLKTL